MIPMNSFANNKMVMHVYEIKGEYVLNIRNGKKNPIIKNFGKNLGMAQNEFRTIVDKESKLMEEMMKQLEAI